MSANRQHDSMRHKVEQALALWPHTRTGRATLINLSENHTFRIDLPDGERRILRVHRPGYQDIRAIESELAWIAALGLSKKLRVPWSMAGRNGKPVQTIDLGPEDGERLAVMFAFDKGRMPTSSQLDLPDLFSQLGEIAAQCHAHARKWNRPTWFSRPAWTVPAMLGTGGLWGDWRQAQHLEEAETGLLETAARELDQAFSAYGTDAARFGLIHADMRLDNLLVHEGRIRLLDFDDCGFGWYVYDFAAAISFMETSPKIPALRQEWLKGYRRIADFDEDAEQMIDPAIVLRRMLLLAWIGSHGETELARRMAPDFAKDTVILAKRWLDGRPLS